MTQETNTPAPAPKQPLTPVTLFKQDNVKKKIEELLGNRSTAFITSILQIVSSNQLLSKADAMSIYHSAVVAATLNLPLNNNLGFAYIVPYNQKQKDGSYKQVAQFQLGYKGFIQLAQRSGQFQTISSAPVYEGQIIESDPLKGFKFDWEIKQSDKIIGYAAYFKLLNGFEKTMYMTVDELTAHGKKFSQSFKSGYGLWKDQFDAMASKTVLKLLLSKFAPLSVEMQRAVTVDQAVVKDSETDEVEYADHEIVEVDKEEERKVEMIANCATLDDLEMLESSYPDWDRKMFEDKRAELKAKKK